MSWTEPIASDQAHQLVDGWLEQMKAPPRSLGCPDTEECTEGEEPSEEAGETPLGPGDLDDEDLAAVSTGWWRRGAGLGALLGVGIGLLVFITFSPQDPAVDRVLDDRVAPASGNLPAVQAVVSPVALEALVEPEPVEATTPGSTKTQVKAPAPRPKQIQAKLSARLSKNRPKTLALQYRRLLRRGWRAYDRADFPTATNAFGRAVHLAPDRTGGYFGLALSLFEQGAEDGAMQVLERGVQKVGPKAGLWVLAGSIYQFKGKDRLARMAYQRYLRNNPRGLYARDVRVILSYKQLPTLLPFVAEAEEEPAAPAN